MVLFIDVLLCWLALLVIRTAENSVDKTWGKLKQEFQTLTAGAHRT